MLNDVSLLDFMQTICFSVMKNIFNQSGSVLNRIWLVLSHIILYIHCFDMFWYFQRQNFWDDDSPFFGGEWLWNGDPGVHRDARELGSGLENVQ